MPRTKQILRQKPTALIPRLSLVQIASTEAADDSDFTMPMKVRHKKHKEAQDDVDEWASNASFTASPATTKKKRKRSSSSKSLTGRYAFVLVLHAAYI